MSDKTERHVWLGPPVAHEVGPPIVVHGDLGRIAADFLARVETAGTGAEATYIGRGWAMPDGYAPDGLWLHVYATTRPSVLYAALAVLEDR